MTSESFVNKKACSSSLEQAFFYLEVTGCVLYAIVVPVVSAIIIKAGKTCCCACRVAGR